MNDKKDKSNVKVTKKFIFEIFVMVLLGWILVQLWSQTVQTFFYTVVGLSHTSSVDTLSISAFVTLIFFLLLYRKSDASYNVISNLTGLIISTPIVPNIL